MSNPANYSPYNKTFKFLMFQNQAYHQRNKLNAKPCVRTNLRYAKSQSQNGSFYNPENSNSAIINRDGLKDSYRCQSPDSSLNRSMFFSNRELRQSNPQISKPKRVIHKHQSFQKFRGWKVQNDNSKLVNRLVSTSCHVIKRQKSQKSFSNHLRYREIRKKYDKEGNRKHVLALGNQILLCPTLRQYNQSGMASKFIEQDMSWLRSTSPKSPRTPLRKRKSHFSCNN